MRFILANLNNPNLTVDFSNIEKLVPDPYISRVPPQSGKYGAFCKSHSVFTPLMKKVIYIVRDPRDVCVSYYKHQQRVLGATFDLSIEEFVEAFVSGEIDGYGTWAENVNSWMACRGHGENFCVIRYENLRKLDLHQSYELLKKMLPELGYKDFSEAYKKSSFDNMQRHEKNSADQWKIRKREKGRGLFVRKGHSGEWHNFLSEICISKIESAFRTTMLELGYNLSKKKTN
jgi:hypothetical protein